MSFIEKTHEAWLEEISTYRDCSIKMINLISLNGAMTGSEFKLNTSVNSRWNADMLDTNAQSYLQTLDVKFVKITGRPARYFFLMPNKKFPKEPDSVLRPSVPDKNNKKTGRSWKYAKKSLTS